MEMENMERVYKNTIKKCSIYTAKWGMQNILKCHQGM